MEKGEVLSGGISQQHLGPQKRNSNPVTTQTNFDNRIVMLKIECPHDYPYNPPRVKFVTKVNLPCVNQANGLVRKAANADRTRQIRPA